MFSFGLLALALALPPVPCGFVILAVSAVAIVFGAGIPSGVYLRIMTVPILFLITGSVALIFSIGVEGGHFSVAITDEGRVTAGLVLLRSLSAVSAMMLLPLTVPIGEILSLMRRWRVPTVLTELMGLMYRLLFVFDGTLRTMTRAQGCRLGYRNLRTSYRSLGAALAVLFIRAMDRAHRMERGLTARGYQGELRVLSCHHAVSLPAVLLVLLVLSSITALGIYSQGGVRWPI